MTHDDPEAPRSQALRERVYGEVRRDTSRGGRIALATGLIALGIFLLIWTVSAYQVTEPHRTAGIIEQGVVSVTDVDRYLAEELPALRDAAEDDPGGVHELPGFPLPVALSGEELLGGSDEQVRNIVVTRASARVYSDGLSAFNNENAQSFPLLSAENAVDTFLGLLTGPFHNQAGIASIVFAGIVGVFIVVAAASDPRPGVLRTIGGALFAGSLAGLVLSAALVYLLGRTGGSDVFTAEMTGIAETIAQVPRRNFFVTTVFSGMLFVAGIGLSVLERRYFHEESQRLAPGEWYDDDAYDREEYWDDEPYGDDSYGEFDDEAWYGDGEPFDAPYEGDDPRDAPARYRD